MGKRAKTHSAVAQQKHWDRLTLKHVENFSRDIIQNGANSGLNPAKETCVFDVCHLLATWRSQSAHVNDDTRYMRLSGAL